ncbi:MAG TPA: UDP-N-acetylmuramoyl-tripeptide--D-alanyl-D-alanine ligase [Actinomycetota bacterium]|nr:UDP-N-acetylmuramoyl-tripeptide--D-alanyl-D-alanine ligase [Actinomycetota bacterium]
MKPRRLSDVARAVRGTQLGDDVVVRSVAIDSREVLDGDLFVALPGERTDGVTFVVDAFDRGAAAAMVPTASKVDAPVVVVGSTNEALLRLATDERRRIDATVVAITGANGKTTTKDLTAAVAATRFGVHASPRSFNNEIGVPVTLLTAPPDTEVVVAELGARHVGDVAELCAVTRPHIAVVTNVGVAHMAIFGSWEKIVEASAEPVEALGVDDVAVLNVDDPVVATYASRAAGRVVRFGRTADADVRASDVTLDVDGAASFVVSADGRSVDVRLGVPGEHMVANALAAIAVGRELGVPLADAASAVRATPASPWRMETFAGDGGIRVVNDAYNANPESTAAALRTARWIAGDGRVIAVLGQMAELGPIAAQEHERIGELAARLRIDRVIAVGDDALPIAVAAVREGVEPGHVRAVDGVPAALAAVRELIEPGDVVLCKGSRVAGLERVAEAFR